MVILGPIAIEKIIIFKKTTFETTALYHRESNA
jgi:hypothetical protein